MIAREDRVIASVKVVHRRPFPYPCLGGGGKPRSGIDAAVESTAGRDWSSVVTWKTGVCRLQTPTGGDRVALKLLRL